VQQALDSALARRDLGRDVLPRPLTIPDEEDSEGRFAPASWETGCPVEGSLIRIKTQINAGLNALTSPSLLPSLTSTSIAFAVNTFIHFRLIFRTHFTS